MKKTTFTVRLAPEDNTQIIKSAKSFGIPRSTLVRILLLQFIRGEIELKIPKILEHNQDKKE